MAGNLNSGRSYLITAVRTDTAKKMTFEFGSSIVDSETNYFWKNNKENQVFTINFTRCGMHFLQRRQGIYRIFPSVVDLQWQVS